MFDVHATLSAIAIGPPVASGGLTMWPLMASDGREPGYDLAGDAFRAGTVQVTEVSAAGTVPTLRVTNTSSRPVLFLDGEHLVGAKQNRVLNVTVLMAASSTLDVPVSCVEAGRWAYEKRDFALDEYLMNAEGRARKMRDVNDTLRRRRSRTGDQADVWAQVSEKAQYLKASSPTGAMRHTYDQHRAALETSVRDLGPVAHQVGAVFAVQGVFAGVELFDCAATLSAMLPKLVRSHALEALDPRRQRPGTSTGATLDAFVARVRAMHAEDYPAVGLGIEVRLEAKGLHGAMLIEEDRMVHLSVLASERTVT